MVVAHYNHLFPEQSDCLFKLGGALCPFVCLLITVRHLSQMSVHMFTQRLTLGTSNTGIHSCVKHYLHFLFNAQRYSRTECVHWRHRRNQWRRNRSKHRDGVKNLFMEFVHIKARVPHYSINLKSSKNMGGGLKGEIQRDSITLFSTTTTAMNPRPQRMQVFGCDHLCTLSGYNPVGLLQCPPTATSWLGWVGLG